MISCSLTNEKFQPVTTRPQCRAQMTGQSTAQNRNRIKAIPSSDAFRLLSIRNNPPPERGGPTQTRRARRSIQDGNLYYNVLPSAERCIHMHPADTSAYL